MCACKYRLTASECPVSSVSSETVHWVINHVSNLDERPKQKVLTGTVLYTHGLFLSGAASCEHVVAGLLLAIMTVASMSGETVYRIVNHLSCVYLSPSAEATAGATHIELTEYVCLYLQW